MNERPRRIFIPTIEPPTLRACVLLATLRCDSRRRSPCLPGHCWGNFSIPDP